MSGERDKRSPLEAPSDRVRSVPPSTDRLVGVPAPGQIIAGKYLVDRVLGTGGMGVVVAARHHQLGQWVAIKFMRGEADHDSGAVSRFVREARAAVALSSEHAAKVLDVGTLETGAPYIVMEYLAGIDLGEVLRQNGPLSVVDAVDAVLQASEAVAEAHSLGIVHRDLKPSNLFVSKRVGGGPLIKVLDFGISKMIDPTAAVGDSLTASGSVMGSPGYMSPEQVRSSKEVDPRTDIWALGVILYELLTGVAPFRADSIGETFARILSESPAPIRAIRPEIPEGLATVIAQCLEREPSRRASSVGELAAKLLPFASPDAGVAVKRILRLSGQQSGGQETITAGPEWASSGAPPDRAETGPAWLRSGSVSQTPARRFGGIPAVASTAAIVIAGAAIGFFVTRGHPSVLPTSASGAAGASSVGSTDVIAPPPAAGPLPAVVEPQVTPPGATVLAAPEVDAGHSAPSHSAREAPGLSPRPQLPRAPAHAPSVPTSTTTSRHETDVY
jgi:serine/threonine-protein kinase